MGSNFKKFEKAKNIGKCFCWVEANRRDPPMSGNGDGLILNLDYRSLAFLIA